MIGVQLSTECLIDQAEVNNVDIHCTISDWQEPTPAISGLFRRCVSIIKVSEASLSYLHVQNLTLYILIVLG